MRVPVRFPRGVSIDRCPALFVTVSLSSARAKALARSLAAAAARRRHGSTGRVHGRACMPLRAASFPCFFLLFIFLWLYLIEIDLGFSNRNAACFVLLHVSRPFFYLFFIKRQDRACCPISQDLQLPCSKHRTLKISQIITTIIEGTELRVESRLYNKTKKKEDKWAINLRKRVSSLEMI
jgi:hypothetical protein